MHRRCAIVARFIDFRLNWGGDMAKKIVCSPNELRFVPTIGGLPKKVAICRHVPYMGEDPPPQKFLDPVFAFQEMGLVFWNYFKNFNL